MTNPATGLQLFLMVKLTVSLDADPMDVAERLENYLVADEVNGLPRVFMSIDGVVPLGENPW